MGAFTDWLKGLTGKRDKIVDPLPKLPEKPKPEDKEEDSAAAPPPPWYKKAKEQEGKKETDPVFGSMMVPYWLKLFGLKIKTIVGSAAAWCGLAAATALFWAGMQVPKDGATAKNWDKYGVALEWKTYGIPQGAIVRINHKGDCKSAANNHVAQANGNCAPVDLLKNGSTIDLLGGNQSQMWKVSTYSVKEICSVRWPSDYPMPPKVTKSKNCTSGKKGNESTR